MNKKLFLSAFLLAVFYLICSKNILVQAADSDVYYYSSDNKEWYAGQSTVVFQENVNWWTGLHESKPEWDGIVNSNNIKKIIFDEGVTEIYIDQLSTFPNVKEIELSKTMKKVGRSFESYLSKLEKITVSKENPYYTSIDGILYDKKLTTIIRYPNGKKNTSYVMPDTITKSYNYTFYSNQYLKTISLGANYKETSTKVIEAYSNVHNLKNINVSKQNKYFTSKDGVLFSKSGKTLYNYPSKHGDSYIVPAGTIVISSFAFYNSSLSDIVFPDGLQLIKDNAFYGTNLSNVNIPKSVYGIGNYAFDASYYTVEEGNKKYISKDGVVYFSNWSGIKLYPNRDSGTTLKLASELRTFYWPTISDGHKIETLIIPKSLEIFPYSGNYLSNIKHIILEEGCENFILHEGALYNKDMTKLIFYPSSLDKKDLVLPESLTSLDSAIFFATAAEHITIPKNLAEIYNNKEKNKLFRHLKNLKSITVAEDNKKYKAVNNLLLTKDGTTVIAIPNKLSIIEIPEGVTTIYDSCFLSTVEALEIHLSSTTTKFMSSLYPVNAPNLAYITVAKDNPLYTSIDGVLYDKAVTNLLTCPNARTQTLIIPKTVTTISGPLPSNLPLIVEEGNNHFYEKDGLLYYNNP